MKTLIPKRTTKELSDMCARLCTSTHKNCPIAITYPHLNCPFEDGMCYGGYGVLKKFWGILLKNERKWEYLMDRAVNARCGTPLNKSKYMDYENKAIRARNRIFNANNSMPGLQ